AAAGCADTLMFCPQFVQKALSAGTSARQDGQERVNGFANIEDVLRAEPQCIQKAAPGFTSPLQRGQVLNDAGGLLAFWMAGGCTGVPHWGQNFLPVTSAPQDVQFAMLGWNPPHNLYYAALKLRAV